MKMTKKLYILIGLFLITLIGNSPQGVSQTEKPVFKYGVSGNPVTIDPAQAWDSASIDILDQVMEGLVAYDLFDPEMALVPRLATNLGTRNAEAMELIFTLRQDVTFHDGTSFNATAVKYTFDRLTYLIENGTAQIAELYEPLADLYPTTPLVINNTVVVNEFTVKFVLNYPYVPFISLLCFSGSYIIHHDMPFDRLIELDEPLIGTGPYMLEDYTLEETHFLAYPGYYRPQPEIQEMRWIRYDDSVALAQALLTGDVNMPDSTLPDYIDDYEANANIHVDPLKSSLYIFYIGMNNHQINQTFRHAISHAINYTSIIKNNLNNQVVRMKSIIPLGMLYHDPTVEPPEYNLQGARQILIDAGLSHGLTASSSDNEWTHLIDTNPIASFNFTYLQSCCSPNLTLELVIQTCLSHIGIKIDIIGVSWPEYLTSFTSEFDRLQFYKIGWFPDYNDPVNMINRLMSNSSRSNAAQINDPWLQTTMGEAVFETNTTTRRMLYSEMQHYIIEKLMPWIFLFIPMSRKSWSTHLGNYPRNPMETIYFYPCTWYSPTTTSTTDTNTTTSETTSTSDTIPTNSSPFIGGNITVILLSLCCVPIALLYVFRKKHPLNRS